MIQTLEDALEFMTTVHVTPHYNLANIYKLCEIFGYSEKGLKCIHITGTNGKGSVCKMVYKILRDAGYSVGLFIGPHLVDVRERFVIDEQWIDDTSFIEIAQKLESLDFIPTRFEMYVMMMLLYFKDKKPDYAVIEVGMGAARDATIVVEPIISAITSIGLDHVKQFHDIEGVIREKSAIIRENTPVVLYGKNLFLEKVAHQRYAPCIIAHGEKETNLLGDFQRKNAAIAYEIGKYIGVDDTSILNSLRHVDHTGRMQYLLPNLLIDAAHNADGIKNLQSYIAGIQGNFHSVYYCFTLKKGKHSSLVTETLGKQDYRIIDVSTQQLGIPEDFLKELHDSGYDGELQDISSLKNQAKKEPQNLFVVFGSLYMIGEFLRNE